VGVGSDPGKASDKHSVDTVRTNLRNGDSYYTVGISSGRTAYVDPYDCRCGVKTIKSRPDAVTDNNLDHLRLCNWS